MANEKRDSQPSNNFISIVMIEAGSRPATQARPDVTRSFGTVAGEISGIAERSGAWVKEQVRSGLDDFVSRVLGLGDTKTPEREKQMERDEDKGLDR